MKKTYTCVRKAVLAAWLAGLVGCAFTEYGNRINAEHSAVEELEKKRDDAESRYVIVLNNLERFPDDPRMISIENWHRFEIDNPDTFRSMYQFWAVSRR